MPVSVFHALTATTPDDPAYEIRPLAHWNAGHAVSLNAVGSEISGAFSNAGNVSFGLDGGGFVTASANVTAAPSPVNVTGANGSSVNAQTIAFSNSNGMTLGVSTAANGATITGSYTVPAIPGATVFSNSNNVSFGLAGSTVTATATFAQSNQAFSASGGSSAFQTLNFVNGNGATFTNNAGSVGLSYTVPNVPAQSQQPMAASAANGSFTANTLSFSNANGISFGTSAGSAITASHNAITTGRASTDAIGLNTAQSNVTWTVNSSGLSFDARGYAGTGTSATNASITLNSNGLAISVAAGGGADGVNIIAAGTRTATTNGTVLFSNANGMTFGLDAVNGSIVTGSYTVPALTSWTVSDAATSATVGRLAFTNSNGMTLSLSTSNNGNHTVIGSYTVPSVTQYFSNTATTFNGANISGSLTLNTAGLNVSLSVAAPGAAAEANAHNLLGANTAGNTTASGSTIGLSGINLTLSGTNNSVINISAPATSSLVGSSGLSISTNGSTISAYAVARSEWNNMVGLAVAGGAQANSLVSIQPLIIEWPVVFSNAVIGMSIAPVSTTNASSAYIDLSVSGVLYSRNASSLSSVASFSQTHTISWSSNATGTAGGVKGITATMVGTTLTPGNYWLAVHVSTTNSATGGANTTALGNAISMIMGYPATSIGGLAFWNGNTNATLGLVSGLGAISTGATLASIPFSSITVTGTRASNAPVAFGLRNDTYQ